MKKAFLSLILLGHVALGKASGADPSTWSAPGQGTFLIMADLHFDPYADPSLVNQLAAEPVDQWQATFETSKLTDYSAYGKDTNYPLLKSALAEAVSVSGNSDFILVNGDYLSHEFHKSFSNSVKGDEKAYQDFVLKTMIFVSREIQQAFPGKPAYFCLGNNDSDCDDYGGLTANSPFLTTLVKEWGTLASDSQAVSTFLSGGYYTLPHPTLKGREMVVLNDVSWSKKYKPQCDAPGTLPKDEMKWLKGVMADAKKNNEKVWILTHMPPGIHARNASEHPKRDTAQHLFYDTSFLWPFLNILAPCRDLVDAEFSGHTHMDDFRLVEDRKGKPVFFTHVAPAVSPVRFNNPGFQVMLYDRTSGAFKDMATYYLPLDRKNAQWALEYDFDQAYGANGYDFANLKKLSDGIENDPVVREKFIKYICVSSTDDPPANMGNWEFFSCSHEHLDPTSYMDCYK